MKKSDVNILIVDDDQTLLASLGEVVKRAGYSAVLAATPAEAEKYVKVKPIHAVMCDCMLPGLNGIDLVIKLREKLTASVPVILFSGIFRDKTYPVEAKAKTGAIEFFTKPLDNKAIIKVLDSHLNSLVDAPKVDLHSLLSTPYASGRERRKALDHVEDMFGYDLPFMFCILMDAESSGHLNIVTEKGDIFGVTLAKGKITQVDTEHSKKIQLELLEKNGYVTSKELSELEVQNKKGNAIKNLISEGLISPHAVHVIRPDQIIKELMSFVNDQKLQVNFVQDRKAKVEPGHVTTDDFTFHLQSLVERQIPTQWLKEFYSTWLEFPIRKGPQFSKNGQVMNFQIVKEQQEFLDSLDQEPTLEETFSGKEIDESKFYAALHLLAIRRAIVFSEYKRAKNFDVRVKRIESLHESLKGKGPFEVFKYFGAGENPSAEDVTKIYKEFARANHPDTLPVNFPEEKRLANNEVFSMVSDAHDVLSNPLKREEFLRGEKQKEAQSQMEAENILAAGAKKIQLGLYSESLALFEEAYKIYSNEMIELHLIWAKLKIAEENPDNAYIAHVADRLKQMDPSIKKTAVYFVVKGIHRACAGDWETAEREFNRAIEADGSFMVARRELAIMKKRAGGTKSNFTASEILTGDLSQIVGSFFKKKK